MHWPLPFHYILTRTTILLKGTEWEWIVSVIVVSFDSLYCAILNFDGNVSGVNGEKTPIVPEQYTFSAALQCEDSITGCINEHTTCLILFYFFTSWLIHSFMFCPVLVRVWIKIFCQGSTDTMIFSSSLSTAATVIVMSLFEVFVMQMWPYLNFAGPVTHGQAIISCRNVAKLVSC